MYKVIVICLLTSLCVFSCGSDTTQETVSENIIQVEENKQTEGCGHIQNKTCKSCKNGYLYFKLLT